MIMIATNLTPTKFLGEHFTFIYDLNKYGIDVDEALNTIDKLDEISKCFDINKKEVISILKTMDLPIDDFFEFSTYGGAPNSFLVAEKALYSEKVVKYDRVKTYYNVYIVPKNRLYCDLIELVFVKKFPTLYNASFFNKKVKRFKNEFQLKPSTNLSDIHFLTDESYYLTCGDVFELIKDPNYINSEKIKSRFKFYDGKNMFLELEPKLVDGRSYPNSLGIPFEALIKKDWSIIENFHVWSIKTDNGWFEGKQKDAEYMNDFLVKTLKTVFFD